MWDKDDDKKDLFQKLGGIVNYTYFMFEKFFKIISKIDIAL